MPAEWETFYFMLGSSAAALIGLLFVVITLTGEVDTAKAAEGQRIFLSPTVFHFVTVLVVSAFAVMPGATPAVIALALAIPGLVGFAFACASIVRLIRRDLPAPHWSDHVFYGALPAVLHLALVVSAWGLWSGASFAVEGVAVSVLGLLLLGIRDAWDLATWLTYHRKG